MDLVEKLTDSDETMLHIVDKVSRDVQLKQHLSGGWENLPAADEVKETHFRR